MKKLALYCRTSTDKQDTGLESQERELLGYCQMKGITEYEVFRDAGISGTKASRPGLDLMLEGVRAGRFHTVLVYSFSRFARNTKQLLTALEEFRKLGVNFASKTEGVDTATPMGELVFTIFAALAKFERDQLSERTKTGLRNARAKGKQIGRRATARAKNDQILVLFSQGMKPQAIADELQLGIASVYRALAARARLV